TCFETHCTVSADVATMCLAIVTPKCYGTDLAHADHNPQHSLRTCSPRMLRSCIMPIGWADLKTARVSQKLSSMTRRSAFHQHRWPSSAAPLQELQPVAA